MTIEIFLRLVNENILFPLISFMMAVAFLVFLWGAFEYTKNADQETERQKGMRHMLYGILGLFVMVSAVAILNIAAGTFGLDSEIPNLYE